MAEPTTLLKALISFFKRDSESLAEIARQIKMLTAEDKDYFRREFEKIGIVFEEKK